MEKNIKFKYDYDINLKDSAVRIFQKGHLIGTCEIRKMDYGFYIVGLEIHNKFRGKGYGKYLLTKSIEFIKWMMEIRNKSTGLIKLIAYPYELESCDDDDIRHQAFLKLVKFYKSFGFNIIQESSGNDSCRMELKI